MTALDILATALDQAAEAIEGTEAADNALPTPCRSWDVRTLVDHLVHDTEQFQEMATGGQGDWSAPPPPAADDRAAAFRAGAAALLAAWRAVDLDAVVRRPMGALPNSFLVSMQAAEFAVHTWDLIMATGQRLDLDPSVAEESLAWARTAMKPEFRGDGDSGMAFGPEVEVPSDAPPSDRLAAFFGRDPAAAR